MRMPSFLYGTYAEVQRKAQEEGARCGARYREDGTFSMTRQTLEVEPEDVIIAKGVVDFRHQHPAWRLYMLSSFEEGMGDALAGSDFQAADALYDATCRETAWGALYFALEPPAPRSAERMASRLHVVLRFWDVLRSARYLWRASDEEMTLELLMETAWSWALDAWCSDGSVPDAVRLQVAAERMARATREECVQAILRRLPQALGAARGLKHREVMSHVDRQRQRLDSLDPLAFERVSSAHPGELIMLLTLWDRHIERQS